ncbi:visual pigment-like receptor peropsin [Trichonephila inaurata madagascariensis]|uniref:Visual pigment-like receptor peropsin n=1 Tax=Trichonephila inaurata madagascariensis TaxID=2747483 RepID=A0A8X6YBF6_9ARAC|nr:visual pigment-like receptor peropsin [Trichonephila inaurata madagascariensis]
MFLRFRGLITPTSLLLINLAVSDLGLILLGFPFSATSSFAGRWLFGEGGCQWYAFMGFLFGSAHIGTLALLALDRYLIACRISLSKDLRIYLHRPSLYFLLLPSLGIIIKSYGKKISGRNISLLLQSCSKTLHNIFQLFVIKEI